MPLHSVYLKDGNTLNDIIKIIEKADDLSTDEQKAITENLPKIKAILKDRPELGKARISNMSWKDNGGDKQKDHNPEGMQACTFERNDQVYISFRGTPRKSWIDNAKAFVEDLDPYAVVANLGIAWTEIKADTDMITEVENKILT